MPILKMNDTVLQAAHINKYFYEPEKFQVLQNVNFEVKKGEFLSIIGKSGCGKSTTPYGFEPRPLGRF